MIDKTIYDEPSKIDADAGTVSVEGPDAVDIQLTPDAAAETSDRLLVGSMKGRGQQLRGSKRRH